MHNQMQTIFLIIENIISHIYHKYNMRKATIIIIHKINNSSHDKNKNF